ncbi:diguanylate cyclase [Mycolicibacterium arabiense]|uniref:Diguanylate cyclase n=1 Tax=Mycolicibacterium arabiense TaxID=1286181 RepID=A0A7I7RZZ3_9MYCO|nr:diguanylate cyclase [Mycolicibacterium arabiense]
MAGIVLGLGLVGPILLAGRLGPRSAGGLIAEAAVVVSCVAMAVVWLRPGWPSRRASQACVVLGSACCAVACIVVPVPSLGILGVTSYAVLGSYVAVFHSPRLLAFTWTVGAGVLAYLSIRVAQVDPSTAVATVLLIVMVNLFAVFACRMFTRLFADDTGHRDLEPVTGLLNRDSFFEQVAGLIGARSRDDDRRLAMLVVSLDGYSLLTGLHGPAAVDRARVAVARGLRETSRRDAVIAHTGDSEFWIADLFTIADPNPLAERVRGVIASARPGLTASVGVVCTPLAPLAVAPAYDVVEELLTIAGSAMVEARGAGGNQTRSAIDPGLTVLRGA